MDDIHIGDAKLIDYYILSCAIPSLQPGTYTLTIHENMMTVEEGSGALINSNTTRVYMSRLTSVSCLPQPKIKSGELRRLMDLEGQQGVEAVFYGLNFQGEHFVPLWISLLVTPTRTYTVYDNHT